MTKYCAQITIEFETDKTVPEIAISGTVDAVDKIMNDLTLPDLVDDNTTKASVRIEAVG